MRILLIVIMMLILANFPLWAQTGTISGFVSNGSADSSLVPNIEVTLFINKGHSVIDDSTFQQTTDSKGRFEFKNLAIDSTIVYYPRANFNSIIYYGQPVRFNSKINSVQSNVVVFDTTSSADKIMVQLEHLFIDAEPGKVIIREIFIVNNLGEKTFIGKNFDNPSQHYVLQFPLPAGYADLEILTPEAMDWVRVQGQTLFHTELMSPGSRQFSYRLVVPSKRNEVQFLRPILYPIGAANIFVSNPDLVIEGPDVAAMGEFNIRGTSFQRYSVTHLMPGMELNLTIKNLPGRTISFQWLVLLGVIILLVIGFGYTLTKSKS